jgi:uncharacterized membrane protein
MPRRYDEDDDEDMPPIRKRELSGLDAMYANTSFPVLILFGVCCSGIALILSIVAVATCTDPVAKKNATTVLIISAIFAMIGCGVNIVRIMNMGPGGGFR